MQAGDYAAHIILIIIFLPGAKCCQAETRPTVALEPKWLRKKAAF